MKRHIGHRQRKQELLQKLKVEVELHSLGGKPCTD